MFHSVAEMPYVDFDVIEEVSIGQQQFLRIVGLVIHSSMVVCAIEQKLTADTVQVIIHIELSKPDMTGSFECLVPLVPQLQAVTFGLQKNVLWHRTVKVPEQVA